MQQNRDQKIADDISKLIFSINPNASLDFQQNIKSYAKKVLCNSVSSRPMTQTSHELKDKIMAKVSTTHDNKAALHCQQSINRLMQSTNVQKKGEILKMLLKCSQLNNKNLSDFSGVFKDQKYNVLNQTQQSLYSNKSQQVPSTINRSSLSFLKSKRPQMTNDISGIRNRGNDSQGISESDILRQITYVLQNIQTNYIEKDQTKQVFNLKPNINVSQTVRRMVSELSDIGWLFKKITNTVVEKGSITKALNLAVQEQMIEYFRWLAVLQNMIKQNQLSLRKLVMWSYQPLQKLKWLAIILDAVMPYSGCQIISIINSFRPQGHIMISQLLNRILSHLIQPFLQYIYHWIYKGQLIDDFRQYFILQNKKVDNSEEWLEKYRLIEQNIPNIIDREAAMMIFNSGKTIYFMKNQCEYSYYPTIAFIQSKKTLNYQNSIDSSNILSNDFTNWLKNVSYNVNQQLVKVLFNHFDLKYHLQSMKNFFLMGKGDFIQHLIDNLGEEMCKPKHQIYEPTLDGYIEDGQKKCFTDFKMKKIESKYISQRVHHHDKSYFANIIKRLLAKRVQYGDTQWDCFNFQYMLKDVEPVGTLLSPSAMKNYQKIFHFLWKVKRIQQTLKQLWMSHLKNYPKQKPNQKNQSDSQLGKILHNCHLLRASMSHFITNLYSYLMIAIQSKWNEFMQKVDKTQSFDEILKVHMQLQEELLDITLNTQAKRIRLQSIMTIFQIIERFNVLDKKLQDQFNNYHQKCRLHQNRLLIAQRSIMSLNNSDYQLPIFEGAKIAKDLLQMKSIYDKAFKTFYEGLKKQSQNGKGSVLLFRLDFSEFYSYQYQPEM